MPHPFHVVPSRSDGAVRDGESETGIEVDGGEEGGRENEDETGRGGGERER